MRNKSKIRQTDLNFCSALETDSDLTPHDVYVALATDAALLALNDQLPDLDDEEHNRILKAACHAAQAVLALARVPDDWISIVAGLNYERDEKVKSILWEMLYDLLPCEDKGLRDDRGKAEKRIFSCVRPGKEDAMERAMGDLSNVYLGVSIATTEAAFHLGYEIAHDPTRLLLEKARTE